jgi:hypothetical protein
LSAGANPKPKQPEQIDEQHKITSA